MGQKKHTWFKFSRDDIHKPIKLLSFNIGFRGLIILIT